MKIQVLTFDNNRPTATTQAKQIDWANASDRRWLQSHMHWALHNRHGVVVSPVIAESN